MDTAVADAVESESRESERRTRHKNDVTSKVLETRLHAGKHILIKIKISILFLDANLETIKIEGEAAKTRKLLFEEKKEPKE